MGSYTAGDLVLTKVEMLGVYLVVKLVGEMVASKEMSMVELWVLSKVARMDYLKVV